MPPKRRHREAGDRMVLRGDTCFDDELPRREVIAVANVASCIDQEVGYLRCAPQYLDFRRACPLFQGSSKEEQLQGQETGLRRDVSRKARRDTRRRMETLELLGRPDDRRGTRRRGRGSWRHRERSGVP